MSTLQENLDAIKLDKDTNLKPENLKAGVTCLGITGTLIQGEDLQEQLDAQDLVIQQLQDELVNKTSGSVKPNVFLQTNEPDIKEGIWIQAEGKSFDKIVFDDEVIAGEEWDKINTYSNIPYNFQQGSAVAIGTNVYLFGSNNSGNEKYAYKYDTINDTYTKLSDIPYPLYQGSAVTIGTDIYLLGGALSSYRKYAYKYDTIANTYTKLTDIPYECQFTPAVAVGTNVYLFGSDVSSSYYKYAYKYDTLTDTYTKLTNIPYEFNVGSVVAIGTDVYLLGGYSSNYTYKYDTINDTYTKLSDTPYKFYYGSAVAIGTNVYLFGSNNSGNEKYAYKYDTINDTYTKLSDIPYQFYQGSAVAITNEKILLLGGGAYQKKIQVFILNYKDYDANSIIIWQGAGKQRTQLFNMPENVVNRALFSFYDAWYNTSEGGLDKTLPSYYGNGTEWVKFKN